MWTCVRRMAERDWLAFPQFKAFDGGQVPLISYNGARLALIGDKDGIHLLDGRKVFTRRKSAPRELVWKAMTQMIETDDPITFMKGTLNGTQPEAKHRPRQA